MRSLGIVALLAAGCGASLQSARPVEPGKTEVTVGLGRTADVDQQIEEGTWLGHLMVRFGVADGFDLGFHVAHTPGSGGFGGLAIDPKVRLLQQDQLVLSLGLPTGVVFDETPDLGFVAGMFMPSLYAGVQTSPGTELVAALRYLVALDEDLEDTELGYGIAIGPRFTAGDRTWAVAPELGIMHGDNRTYLTIGVSISAGN